LFEFLGNQIIKELQKQKVFCWNNGTPESLRIIKNEYTSWQVEKFITRIFYPPNINRDHGLVVYIHFIEYMTKKIIENEDIKIKNLADYEKVYDRVLEKYEMLSEAERFYKNWLKREDFKNARYSGRIKGRKKA